MKHQIKVTNAHKIQREIDRLGLPVEIRDRALLVALYVRDQGFRKALENEVWKALQEAQK